MTTTGGDQPAAAPVDWAPNWKLAVALQVIGTVVALVGVVGYGLLWAVTHPASQGSIVVTSLWPVVLVLVGTLAAMVVHEGVHGLAMLPMGARPTFGAALVAKLMPVFYCTATGHRFTRRQFTLVAMAPLVVVSVLLGVLVVCAPMGGAWAVVGGFHLGGCVGDLAMTVRARREPPGTLVEDRRDGMRFHRGVAHPA